MKLKTQLLNRCEAILKHKLENLNAINQDLMTALESESKSTAGDKHETGRAMLQLEREKIGEQIKEVIQCHFSFFKK